MTPEQKAKLAELLGTLNDVEFTAEVEAALNAASKPAAPAPAASKGFQKFGENPYGITNDKGESVTPAYISRYVQCNCRENTPNVGDYTHNRKGNFEFFRSAAFLSQCVGMHANAVGKKAATDYTRWNMVPLVGGTSGKARKQQKQQPVAPATDAAVPDAAALDAVTLDVELTEAPDLSGLPPVVLSKKQRKALADELKTVSEQVIALDINDPAAAAAIEVGARRVAELEAELAR
jgi:hypothetical protein